MKSIKKIFAVLLVLLMLLSLAACGGDSTDNDTYTGSENEETQTDTSASTNTGSGNTDTSTEGSKPSDSDSDTDTSAGGDKPSDGDTDTGTSKPTEPSKPQDPTEPKPDGPTDTNDGGDTDQITPEPEPEPEPEPTKPTPEILNIIKDGKSDYTIVYQNTDICRKYATALRTHITEKYGITLRMYNERLCPDTVEHKIVVGKSHEDIKFVRDEVGDSNDFAVTVLGDDLVLYAPNDYLYGYMYELAKEKIFVGGGELVVEPSDSFTLATSREKDYNYAEYLKSKGNFNLDKLLLIFEEGKYIDGETTLPYRIYVPSDYDPQKSYPVVTILHGAGERGNDNQAQLKNMVPALFNQNNSKYMDAIIICPQCPSGQQWVDTPWTKGNYSVDEIPESNELKAAFGLSEWAKYNLAVDLDRVYIMGLSMGGFGTWDMIMRHKESFTAAIPICGGADPEYAEYLKDFPIWTLHGTRDSSVPYAGTEAMCQALKEAGSTSYHFDTLENQGHIIWDTVGNSNEIADWLFSQGE